MSFAQPLFLAGLLGALVPIIIHLIHRRRPRKQPFPAIELVIQSVQRVERRWRLRRFLLLAARVLLIAALAMAAARPLWGPDLAATQERAGPERLAIVIDATMSMRARYDGEASFERATTEARNLIDGMGAEDMAVLIAVDTPPRVLVERPTADKGLLLARLGDLEPSFMPGDAGEAVSTAVQTLGMVEPNNAPDAEDKPSFSARVVVLSDMAQSSFQGSAVVQVPGVEASARIEVVDVLASVAAERRTNRAVTAIEAAPVPGRTPRTIEVRTRVQSFARERDGQPPEPVDVTLREADRDLALATTDVVPGTIVDKVMRHSFESAGAHPVTVVVEPDALAEDDVRYAKVNVRRQVRTLVVDGAPSGVPKEDEVFYLERALQTGAADQPPPRIIGADDMPRADLAGFDVVILAGVDVFNREEGARLIQFVEAGGGLLVTTSKSLDAELYNSELGRLLPRLLRGLKEADIDPRGAVKTWRLEPPSPDDAIAHLFRGEAVGGLLSTQTSAYWLLQPESDRTPIAVHLRYQDGQPTLVSRSFGSGRTALLTTSIDRDMTDLPIRPAFVPLIRQLVLYLGRALERPDDRRTAVGQPRVVRVPEGARRLQVVGPDGRQTELTDLDQDDVTFEHTRLPGHYRVLAAFAGPLEPVPNEYFTVNVDTRESDLKPLSTEEARAVLLGETVAAPNAPRASAAGIGQRLDPEALAALLLMVMVFAFVTESALSAWR